MEKKTYSLKQEITKTEEDVVDEYKCYL